MKEIWKPLFLEDIQERYAVSSLGRVLDLKNHKFMTIHDNGAGYKNVSLLAPASKQRIRYVHRLVAHVFIVNPDGLPQVGHKDHDRANNHVDNLYWTTPKQNTADGIAAGKINAKKRPNTKKLTKENICQVAKMSVEGMGVNQIAIALGFPRTTISSVFNGRSNWELFEFARDECILSLNPLTSPQKPEIIALHSETDVHKGEIQ